MTPEDKQLLFRDLCARLPYGIRYKGDGGWGINPYQHTTSLCTILNSEEPLVYLRPMESMTEEEKAFLGATKEIEYTQTGLTGEGILTLESYDYLNSIHVDYRGLIPMGLALEAPADMYKN